MAGITDNPSLWYEMLGKAMDQRQSGQNLTELAKQLFAEQMAYQNAAGMSEVAGGMTSPAQGFQGGISPTADFTIDAAGNAVPRGNLPVLAQQAGLPKAPGQGFVMEGQGAGIGGGSAARAASGPVGPEGIRIAGAAPQLTYAPQAAEAVINPWTGQKVAAGAAEAAGAAATGSKLGRIVKSLGKGGAAALALAPVSIASAEDIAQKETKGKEPADIQVAKIAGQTDALDPLIRKMAKAYVMVNGYTSDASSNLTNFVLQQFGWPAQMARYTNGKVDKALTEFSDWASATPQESQAKAKAQVQKGQSPLEAVQALLAMDQEQAGQGEGVSQEFPIGNQMPELPDTPQMPTPATTDMTEIKNWLDQAKPTRAAKTSDDQMWVRGAMNALQSIQGNESVGQLLGKLGLGVMSAKIGIDEKEQAEDQKYAKAQQDYAAMRAGTALDFAKLDTDQQNRMLEVAYKNAMIKHEDAIKRIELGQPKFLGMQQGIALYQTKDQNGQMVLKSFDTGLLRQQALYKAMGRKMASGNGTMGDLMAGDISPINDEFGFFSMIASELANKGVLPSVLNGVNSTDGESNNAFEQLDSEIRQRIMTMPGTDAQKQEEYKKQLIGMVAGAMMNNPNFIGAAVPYSAYARMLASQMQSGK